MRDHPLRFHPMGFLRPALTLAVFLGASALSAEPPDEKAAPARWTATVGHYPAGALKRSLFGAGYRTLWDTPITVEILDLKREAGGLTPAFRVGGEQTKGLALSGADGRSYTFRGLEKDASHLLDEIDPDLKDTLLAKLLNDLMSAQHPASELIARGIQDAAGIPGQPWRLVVLPDDPALGDYREDFAGEVGVFGVYPQPAHGNVPGFLDATEILEHDELYKRLENGETADVQALLKARLVDILMGDWDRHRKQWRWAKIPGKTAWTPIPEDRDQAFSRYEGFVLDRARSRDPRFQAFGPKYAGIGGLTYNGWEQDRRLLVGFSREDFIETASALKAQLTDDALEKAARRMPPEWYPIDGPRLLAALRARRNALPEIAVKYYEHLAKRVDVYMTNQSEQVEAKRLGNGDMDLTVRVVEAGGELSAPTFHRLFHGKETEEVRLYTLGGNDTVKLTGGSKGPRVRMIGGVGNDTLDASGSDNAKLSDSEGQNRAIDAADDRRRYTPPPPPRNAPWIPPRDFTRETWGWPILSYNADLGVFVGYQERTESFGFRKTPYDAAHVFSGGWSFNQQGGRVEYRGDFRRENSGTYFGVYALASAIEILRFYGFGNETQAPATQDFFKANTRQYLLYPTFHAAFAKDGLFTIGPAVKYTSSDQTKDQQINVTQPYGVGKFGEVAVHAILSWDGRDDLVFPRHGGLAVVRGSYFPKAWDVKSQFGQVNGNLNGYFTAGPLTLALRVGGKKVFGTYPYMDAASLGQGGLGRGALAEPESTLRGYRARRYQGDSSAFGNSDLRLRISHITLIVPGQWGLTGFGDVGRVWLKGETSDTWHAGVGGGIWVSFLRDRMAFSTGIAHSKEEDLFYLTGGFGF